jgi:tetratricopeptide (TPR) repeat protein
VGAVYHYGKAIEVKPDYAMAFANRGLCRLYEGDDDEAQKDFDRAKEIDGNLKASLEGYIAKVKQERLARH